MWTLCPKRRMLSYIPLLLSLAMCIGMFEWAVRERSRHAQADTQARAYYEMLHDGALAFCILDPDGKITTWSRGAEEMFGYKAVEALSQQPTFLMPEDIRKVHRPVAPNLNPCDDIHNIHVITAPVLAKDGKQVLSHLVVRCLLNSAGRHYAIIFLPAGDTANPTPLPCPLFSSPENGSTPAGKQP